jgi:hypothetical protein
LGLWFALDGEFEKSLVQENVAGCPPPIRRWWAFIIRHKSPIGALMFVELNVMPSGRPSLGSVTWSAGKP